MKFKKLRMIIIEANKTLDNPLRHLRENNHVRVLNQSANKEIPKFIADHADYRRQTTKQQ